MGDIPEALQCCQHPWCFTAVSGFTETGETRCRVEIVSTAYWQPLAGDWIIASTAGWFPALRWLSPFPGGAGKSLW